MAVSSITPGVASYGSITSCSGAVYDATHRISTNPDDLGNKSLDSWRWKKFKDYGRQAMVGVYLTFLTNGVLTNINNTVSAFFRNSEFMRELTTAIKDVLFVVEFGQLLLVPSALYTIGCDIYGLVKGEITKGDFLVSLGQNMSFLAFSVVTLLKMLVRIGAIPLAALKYITPFGLVGVILHGINVVAGIKAWIENNALDTKFENLIGDVGCDFSVEDIAQYRTFFEYVAKEETMNDQSIAKHFGVEANSLRERVNSVAIGALNILQNNSASPLEKIAAKGRVLQCRNALRGRVKSSIVVNTLSIINGTVGAVVGSLLFASPYIIAACPLAVTIVPVILSVSMTNACVSLGRFLYQRAKHNEFKNSILFAEDVISKTKNTATSTQVAALYH